MSRFPSSVDPRLRSQKHLFQHSQVISPNPNPHPNHHPISFNHQGKNTITYSGNGYSTNNVNAACSSFSCPSEQHILDQAKQMAYQDSWRVSHPNFKSPFISLEEACERLLPYHVVADYEEEEDDKILDSDSSTQCVSCSQQWERNISAKVAEFTTIFEKQVLAFNIISKQQKLGELRTEEKLMIEQMLLQDEKKALLEARAEMESTQRAYRMAQSEQMVFQGAALGPLINNIPIVQNMNQQDKVANTALVISRLSKIGQKDKNEPSH